ncbi:MAG: hypothetical protein WC326_09570 [Candidatus Delongbacteria bacterium]
MKTNRLLLPMILLAGLLLLAGCAGRQVRPERLDEAAMRAWIEGNWQPLTALRLSWRGQYQDAETDVPFRVELAWCADSTRLALCSPFGGELAVFRCSAEQLAARSGAALPGWLERVAGALEGRPADWLDWGAARLAGLPEGVSVELKDPSLAPLLVLALDKLPAGVLDEGLCRRESLAPWLWGEWRPPLGARWRPAERRFEQGKSSWSVGAASGLVEQVEQDGWSIQLDGYERRSGGVVLPGRMSISQPAARRRVVLQLREAQVTEMSKE